MYLLHRRDLVISSILKNYLSFEDTSLELKKKKRETIFVLSSLAARWNDARIKCRPNIS